MKILVATEKPFAPTAVSDIRDIVEKAGYQFLLLEKYTDKTQLLDAVKDVDALIVSSDKVTAEVIDAAKNLKIVVRAGAGYDNVDLAAANARKIVVMNTPGQNSNAVAELALGMMIYMARNQFNPGTGSEISKKRLGIHAYGHIGAILGRYGNALDMKVYAYSRSIAQKKLALPQGINGVESVEQLYGQSDYLSIHVPVNEQTKKSIGYDLLSKLPKGAVIINTARKEVIDEAGLLKVMEERTDLKYATDVKPDNYDELVAKCGNRVFATPKKMGAETKEANINAGLAAARQAVGYLKDGDTTFQVNK